MKRQDPLITTPSVGNPAPLGRDALTALQQGNRCTGVIAKLRASHHAIARLIATGLTYKEVAAYTGYTPIRVGQLAEAPAMKELIATYIERIGERQLEAVDAYLVLKTSNMIAAERHIADHIAELDEANELLPVKTALAISADGADRTGYGKRQTNLNINADFAAMLEKAIKRSGKTIDARPAAARPTARQLPPATPSTDSGDSASPRPLILRRA